MSELPPRPQLGRPPTIEGPTPSCSGYNVGKLSTPALSANVSSLPASTATVVKNSRHTAVAAEIASGPSSNVRAFTVSDRSGFGSP